MKYLKQAGRFVSLLIALATVPAIIAVLLVIVLFIVPVNVFSSWMYEALYEA